MGISYRLIAPNDLDAPLMNAWRAIQLKSDALASPYFAPEFTQLVASVRADVRVVVIENAGQPVGFFPYQRSLLGMGKPVGGPLSDYHGVIAEPCSEWSVKDLMHSAKLAVWAFDHLVDSSGKFDPHVTARATSPQIDLRPGYANYARGRREAGSDYIRKTEGLARKLAREVGEVNFTLHQTSSGPMDRLIEWKSDQYRRARLADAFGVRWTGELLRRVMNTQATAFGGVCSVLSVGDRVVAVHLGMRSPRVLHYWFPAYDSAFARFSTGIILLLRMAEALASTEVQTIDLGRGDSPYKQRLMTGATELREGAVALPSLLASARQFRQAAEASAARGGLAATLRLPLRVARRIERQQRFR